MNNWVNTLEVTLAEETFDPKKTNVSWSGYHAGMQTSVQRPPAVIDLLPMFRDNARSVSMVKHGLDMLQKVTLRLNPGQATVLTLDQPLYTSAKKIQWSFPNLYGEQSFIIMMGGLHIEMA